MAKIYKQTIYTVEIIGYRQRVEIEADSEERALEIVETMFDAGEFEPDGMYFEDAEFKVVDKEEIEFKDIQEVQDELRREYYKW